ncbi:NlpC/P60 family protein [Pseudonocardia abyssalis]|uniref:C40 family peptidase n=1 Tax=Pseudonocardia abyssalis TaxID=2792008 RepID=A0ABS6UMA4_9PSEU|nr:NlpC/P60 family protein [Pseudonocardia abyssalis]MBW0116922.1 C40 family peptidase [Pseudonocardia abyssalis]MBW0133366.1 C40 family peptidase [Pseudonocardia abyssalis]
MVLALLLAGALALVLGIAPASAQPAPPDNAEDAATALEQVQREAEALTEEWHAAKDELTARQDELERMSAAVEPARQAADAARAGEEEYRLQVDALTMSTFEGGNLDQFNALLASGSPEDFLDQMSVLELLATDQRAALEQLIAVVEQTEAAQAEADAATARAQSAADAAVAAEQDVAARKRDAEMRIEEAERLLERLSPQERSDRLGPAVDGPSGPVTGSGAGVVALRAAITQLGKPYQWGAEGPGSFDCSGLTSWAFSEAGVTLPRSSSQQARVGQAVAWDDMRPGDLVFYYSPVSHVGIYAGDGKMVNAPQSGDVVKYATVSSSAFSGARRL